MDATDDPLEQVGLEQLRRRTSVKWRHHGDDVLPLWVAEMDVLPAPSVAAVLHAAVTAGDTGYPAGGQDYAEALSGFASARWGWTDLDPARTGLVPDVMLGIVELLQVLTDPGDAVVLTPPVYAPFHAFVAHAGRRIVEAPLGPDGRLDLDALDAACGRARAGGGRAALLLCSPHNPTGVVHTTEELAAVAAITTAHGVRVVVDEIHAPLVLSGATFVPYLTVPGTEDAFVLHSASKGWNLAGLKAAVAVAGPDAAADLARVPEEVAHGASHFGVLAHTAALRDGGPWLDRLLVGLAAKRALFGELLDAHLPQLRWRPNEGTYLAWVDCRALGIDDDAQRAGDGPAVVTDLAGPARFVLDEARVALSAGHVFGTGGAGHVRVNLATSASILREAVVRIERAVAARDG